MVVRSTLKIHVLNVLPDLGALNYCMHKCPENKCGVAMVWRMIPCIWIWDVRPSIWNFANWNYEKWQSPRVVKDAHRFLFLCVSLVWAGSHVFTEFSELKLWELTVRPGWHYLSNATCLMRPRLFYMRSSSRQYSPQLATWLATF